MNHMLIALTILVVTSVVHAKGVADNTSFQTSTYPDGILFDVKGVDIDMHLTVSGPGNYIFAQRHAYPESVFLDINNVAGERLADGLYKYEVRPIPAVTLSREESAKMRDLNVLHGKSAAKVSPSSGSFRIVNGRVVDPNRDEYETPALLPTEIEK